MAWVQNDKFGCLLVIAIDGFGRELNADISVVIIGRLKQIATVRVEDESRVPRGNGACYLANKIKHLHHSTVTSDTSTTELVIWSVMMSTNG